MRWRPARFSSCFAIVFAVASGLQARGGREALILPAILGVVVMADVVLTKVRKRII
jgi:hypothetical protein